MKGVPAIYKGRIVDKAHFRVFIYAQDGAKKLVESWDDYERHMESGLWFALREDAMARVAVEKPKKVKKAVKPVEIEEPIIEEELIHVETEVVNAAKDDDFLPKARK
jgi:sulfur transfer complex TusBCD TusB component (DsrH family)